MAPLKSAIINPLCAVADCWRISIVVCSARIEVEQPFVDTVSASVQINDINYLDRRKYHHRRLLHGYNEARIGNDEEVE